MNLQEGPSTVSLDRFTHAWTAGAFRAAEEMDRELRRARPATTGLLWSFEENRASWLGSDLAAFDSGIRRAVALLPRALKEGQPPSRLPPPVPPGAGGLRITRMSHDGLDVRIEPYGVVDEALTDRPLGLVLVAYVCAGLAWRVRAWLGSRQDLPKVSEDALGAGWHCPPRPEDAAVLDRLVGNGPSAIADHAGAHVHRSHRTRALLYRCGDDGSIAMFGLE